MPKFLSNRRYRFILILPLVFLVLNAVYFKHTTKEIKEVMLNEKYIEIVDEVDMLAAAANANTERFWLDHEDSLRESVEFIDHLFQIYAGLYKYIDGQLTLISERAYQTSPIDPLDYKEFRDLVNSQEDGKYTIGYTPDNQTYRELHLYFKWMPTYTPENERFLVVAGVSLYSVVTKVALWVSVGQWISMIITFAFNVWMVLMITRLGNIYDKRTGDKWREEPEDYD